MLILKASVRRLVLVATALILTGCARSSPQIEACEQSLKWSLKTPDSYKRINASGIKIPDHKPPYYSVSIEYDAANVYGTLIRETKLCAFKLDASGAPTTDEISLSDLFSGAADDLEKAADAALEDASKGAAGVGGTAKAEAADIADLDAEMNEPEVEPRPIEQQYPGNCYKDYCPCEPPQGGPDQLICDRLEEGLSVDVEMMINGRALREARRQLEEFEASNRGAASH